MGWILRLANRRVQLIPSNTVVAGRHESCQLRVIGDDQDLVSSVSRKHAIFELQQERLVLQDVSRFGTFLNGKQIPKEQFVPLSHGDQVVLGVGEPNEAVNLIIVNRSDPELPVTPPKILVSDENSTMSPSKPLMWTSSKLTSSSKAELRKVAQTLGVSVVTEWNDKCTHLIVESLILTGKLLMALLNDTPIVSIRWIQEIDFQLISNNQLSHVTLPDPLEYTPDLSDEATNAVSDILFDVSAVSRKRIFEGMHFLFFELDQMQRNEPFILCAGGSALRLELSALTVSDFATFVEAQQTFVVFPEDSGRLKTLQNLIFQVKVAAQSSWKKLEFREPISEGLILQCILNPLKYTLREQKQSNDDTNTPLQESVVHTTNESSQSSSSKIQRSQSQSSSVSQGNVLIRPLLTLRRLEKHIQIAEKKKSEQNFKKFRRKRRLNDGNISTSSDSQSTSSSAKRETVLTYIPDALFADQGLMKVASQMFNNDEQENASQHTLDRMLEEQGTSTLGRSRGKKKGNIFKI